jgi:adenine-specific DNA-methyltransferase
MTKEQLIKEGFHVIETTDLPQLHNLEALKEYIQKNKLDVADNLENLVHLIKVLVEDEKVNGYGLNFVGRNVATARYTQKTEKELQLNTTLSKNIDTTQNLLLKGDNLDSLKILKKHYNGQIKCIYIDPPYNTASEEFVYPDKFDKEETEVLGLQNLSQEDYDRMEFGFKSKKNHNGWLSFIYPRLLLARDLLSKDGVIFISIDDNEQANLKLLCDEIFGEENFLANLPTIMNLKGNNDEFGFAGTHEYTLVYSKNKNLALLNHFILHEDDLDDWQEDEKGFYKQGANLKRTGQNAPREDRPNLYFPIFIDSNDKVYVTDNNMPPKDYFGKLTTIYPITNEQEMSWRWSREKIKREGEDIIVSRNGSIGLYKKQRPALGDLPSKKPKTLFYRPEYSSGNGTAQVKELLGDRFFSNPKPLHLIKDFLEIATNKNDIILDFFAGSGTTGHAVMELNAEDGGNRKFILCQIDEPISKDKPAYQFCVENNLPPVISSITVERLKRAGEKLRMKNDELGKKETEKLNFESSTVPPSGVRGLDIGFKVFDSISIPKLEIDEITQQISMPQSQIDALSRVYNMIFEVGLETVKPTQMPEMVIENCMYRVGTYYFVTNCEKISKEEFSEAIKNGTVYIDGWTASLNSTLRHYKDDLKIVF